MKLYLVRHGASTGNTPGCLLGQSDHPLTERGLAQARAVAARLAPLGPMPVYCSDLRRARQTAETIARVGAVRGGGGLLDAAIGVAPRVFADARLREIDLGEYEGRSWDEFLADTALNEALASDPYVTALPGGESLAVLEERVLAAVADIVAACEPASAPAGPEGALGGTPAGGPVDCDREGCACLVAHDGPIRAIINHYLGVPPENWWTLSTDHGGVSLVEWTDGWVNVRFVNGTSHLAQVPPDPPREAVGLETGGGAHEGESGDGPTPD